MSIPLESNIIIDNVIINKNWKKCIYIQNNIEAEVKIGVNKYYPLDVRYKKDDKCIYNWSVEGFKQEFKMVKEEEWQTMKYINNGIEITHEWKPCRVKQTQSSQGIHYVKLNSANKDLSVPKDNPYLVKYNDEHIEMFGKKQFDSLFIMVYEGVGGGEKMVTDNKEPGKEVHETGAVRSTDANHVRFDLITPVGLRRLAETYQEGAEKYGVDNWKKGFKISGLINHAINHINSYIDGDGTEDHLAHAVWNLMTAMHFEERMPQMQDMCEQIKLIEKREKREKEVMNEEK